MDKMTFTDAVEKIFRYYEYKAPERRRLEMIFDKVSAIDSKAVPWITDKITDDFDTPPRNIARAFRIYYARYCESYRATEKETETIECKSCHGEGFLFFRVANKFTGIKYRQVAICGDCQNWKRFGSGYDQASKDSPAFPMKSRKGLESSGLRME